MGWFAYFNIAVACACVIDLMIFGKKNSTLRTAICESAIWVALSAAFGFGVYQTIGPDAGSEWFSAYFMEKALSVDNLFVMLLIFNFFNISKKDRHKALFWGIIGVIVLRGAFILGGTTLIASYDWLLYVFAAVLLWSGAKLTMQSLNDKGQDEDIEDSLIIRTVSRFKISPLIAAIVCVELSDLMFAMDSIPVVFALTKDPMIAYTSNIMAVLGLRALYSVVEAGLAELKYLQPALAAILLFIAVKVFIHEFVHISPSLSMALVGAILTAAVVASLAHKRNINKEIEYGGR